MWGKMREDLQSGSFFKPRPISDINAQVSKIDGFSKKSKLDIQLQELEEELRKIDAFKRELPLCMHLLKEAIERLTEEGLQWKGEKVGAVMEEFIPMKSDLEERQEAKISNDWSEKKDWMSSFQLWSNPLQFESKFDTRNQESDLHPKSSCQEENEVLCNLKNGVGDSVSFNKPVNEEKGFIPVRGLSPSIPIVKVGSKLQKRKQRRCWSPELHESFVNALHQLGGEQATPKQIRELMKVDGLTNDEIKSHLQKYRLHIRKLSTSSTSPSNCSWLTKDRYGDFSKENDVSYGSPQFPFHLGGSLKGESITRRDCVKEEEEEDEKSKFHSWKGRVQNTLRDVYRLHPGILHIQTYRSGPRHLGLRGHN